MLTMKNIIKEGHNNLTLASKEVSLPLSNVDKKTLREMAKFIVNSQDEEISKKYNLRAAVGLAAPQINILKRMFAIDVRDLDGTRYQFVLVNPIIVNHSNELIFLPDGEGCLSVDRETKGLLTPRFQTITFEALMFDLPTEELIPITMTLSGYVAIVFQHEYDHLNGVLFTSKMFSSLENAKPAYILEEN